MNAAMSRSEQVAATGARLGLSQTEPDWLLVWDREDDTLIRVHTGTHADLSD